MNHLFNRQKGQKTLALSVLLQHGIWLNQIKRWLFFWKEILFVYFVAEGHILRRIEESVDFEEIVRILETKYSNKITPISRVEPIRLFKLYRAMFIYPVPSERELCRRANSDLAIRWFCEFGLFGKISHHSFPSKFRTRLGTETFLRVFEYIVYCCAKAGLVRGNHISIDGSNLLANARGYTLAQQATRLTEEFIRRLFGTEYIETERKSRRFR